MDLWSVHRCVRLCTCMCVCIEKPSHQCPARFIWMHLFLYMIISVVRTCTGTCTAEYKPDYRRILKTYYFTKDNIDPIWLNCLLGDLFLTCLEVSGVSAFVKVSKFQDVLRTKDFALACFLIKWQAVQFVSAKEKNFLGGWWRKDCL